MIALLVAAVTAVLFSLVVTPYAIKLFRRLGWGQMIRVDGPAHQTKQGTATKGGLVFITSAVLGYFVGHLVSPGNPITASGLLVVLMMVGMGAVGFADDFLKTHRKNSAGLSGWQKVGGQVVIATVFALLSAFFPSETSGLTPASTSISFVRDISWLNLAFLGAPIGVLLMVLWVNLLTISTANAVNVTDGLDGLATGASIITLSAYLFIAFFQANQACHIIPGGAQTSPSCFEVRDPIDLAVISASLAGSLVGYLWWSGPPAHIFMGDTGSLAIGGTLAGLAVLTRTELLILIIGALYVMITGSVVVQRIYFKATHGKRIFLMSPIHHHFELKGWAEVTIVIRFWLIAGISAVLGVSIFYLSWLQH